jgi:hypothetical protein
MFFGSFTARSRSRRNIASAFVGEIAAAMESVEEHAEVRRLELFEACPDEAPFDFSDFQLPKLAVYEANVDQLALFNAPLPREVSYFYTRLMALPGRLRALRLSSPGSIGERKQRT